MKSLLIFLLGLLVGACGIYFVLTQKSSPFAMFEEADSKSMELFTKPIEFEQAKQWYCNYLSKADQVCKSTMNTRYLNISTKELLGLYLRYTTAFGKIDGIRLYPMIYDNTCPGDTDKRNLINVCIVPLKDKVGKWENKDLVELYKKERGQKVLYFFKSPNSTENQVGQCPPGSCNTTGSILLNEVAPTIGIMVLKPNCAPFDLSKPPSN